MIVIKSERELRLMREAGKIVADTLHELEGMTSVGVATQELDLFAGQYIMRRGAKPAFKGYRGFPANICTSVNEQVVHGIPGQRRLRSGDIISIDLGVFLDGYCADAAVTLPVGEVDEEVQRLLEVTQKALEAGVQKAIKGNRLGEVSHAIQSLVERCGFSVVRDYVGHGIGKSMHEEPPVPNFGLPGHGPRLRPGTTLAIEPMVNMGTHEVEVLEDNWTVVTKDRKPSAHFEHTVAVTERGPWVLTAR